MKYITATIVIAFVLTTILVSCMVITDSTVTDANFLKEHITGTKDDGVDLSADCDQHIGKNCKED